MLPHLERLLRGRHGDRARASFTLVAPLVDVDVQTPATDTRSTDTEQYDLFASGAAAPLSDGRGGVDCATDGSTLPTATTPGSRTSTTATRTTTTRTTGTSREPSARWKVGISYSELLAADLACRRAKRSSTAARAWEMDQAGNLAALFEDLNAGTYAIGPSICFVITRPKHREVWAAGYRDRVVHHALYNAIGPRFEKRFIADSCACILGRGTHYAARRLEAKVRAITANWTRPAFYLKVDIASFFPSIDKRRLGARLEAGIQEPFWRSLALQVLHHDPRPGVELRGRREDLARIPAAKSLFGRPAHQGLPIGNLSSQFGANVLLDALDQHAKHALGIRHYIRYVDDIVLLHESPRQLNTWRAAIDAFLQERLELSLNPAKTILQPIERGIDFVGQVLKPHRRTLRRRTFNSALRRLDEIPAEDLAEAATSYLGLLRQCTHSHTDRARLVNVARRRGFAVDHHLTKVYA